jgi:hypothetical protein
LFCQQLSAEQLLGLRAQALALAFTGATTGEQHDNLSLLLEMVNEKLLKRCVLTKDAECLLPSRC